MVDYINSDETISMYQISNRQTLFMPFKIRPNQANQAINAIKYFTENEILNDEKKRFGYSLKKKSLNKSSSSNDISSCLDGSKHTNRTKLRVLRKERSKLLDYKGNQIMSISPSTTSDSTGSDMLSNIAFDLKPLCESLPKLKVTTPNLLHDEVSGAFSLYAKSKENFDDASKDFYLDTDASASLYCSELDFPSDADASVCSYDSSVTISSVESIPRNFYDPKVHRMMPPNHGFIVVPVPKILNSERNKCLRDTNTSPKNILPGEESTKALNTSRAMIRLVFPSPSKMSKSLITQNISTSALSKCANVAENLLQMNTRRKVKREWEPSEENIMNPNLKNDSTHLQKDNHLLKKSCLRATPNLFRVPSPPPPKRLLRSRKNLAQQLSQPLNEEEANALYNAVDEYLKREKLEREHNIKHWLLQGQSRKASKIPGHFPVHPMKTRSSSKHEPTLYSNLHNIQKKFPLSSNRFKVKRLASNTKKGNVI